jgi:hypothetical protein
LEILLPLLGAGDGGVTLVDHLGVGEREWSRFQFRDAHLCVVTLLLDLRQVFLEVGIFGG